MNEPPPARTSSRIRTRSAGRRLADQYASVGALSDPGISVADARERRAREVPRQIDVDRNQQGDGWHEDQKREDRRRFRQALQRAAWEGAPLAPADEALAFHRQAIEQHR